MTARWDCGCDHWRKANRKMKVPKNGDEFDLRKFNPGAVGYRPNAVPSEVLTDCCPVLHLTNIGERDAWSMALYADGACQGNGTPRARASVGVFGTPDAWYNLGVPLPLDIPQTNQSAEIYSAIYALHVARAIIKERWIRWPLPADGHVFSHVLLMMDSSYVVRAITEWIRKWRVNGFRNSRGEPIANMKALVALDTEVRRLFEEHLIIVQFWHVPRIHNVGADWLAAQALRGNIFNIGLDSDLNSNLDELSDDFARQVVVSSA